MLWSQFCDGSYQSRSPTLDCEQTVNLYPATVESQTNSKQKSLIGTPGLRRLLSVGTTQCRGMFSEDGRTWCVTGGVLYELDLTANTATSRGTISDDGKPVSFASNGRGGEQLAICGGGSLYVLDLETNVLTGPVAVPLTNAAVSIAFIDGYFLLLEASTVRIWFSSLEDGLLWDALDFFARSQLSHISLRYAPLHAVEWRAACGRKRRSHARNPGRARESHCTVASTSPPRSRACCCAPCHRTPPCGSRRAS